MTTDTLNTRANGESSTSLNGQLNASELFQKHEEGTPHNPTVEDVIDEEDVAHPPPSSLNPPEPAQVQSTKPSKLDTQSEEAFPSLGAGPKSKAPANTAPSWGARKNTAYPKNAAVGKANGNTKKTSVTSPPSSRASTPASGNITPAFAGPAQQQSPFSPGPFSVSIPGKTTREIKLRAEHMNKEKSLTPLIHDINRKLKVKVSRLDGQGIVTFQATGAPNAVEQALQQIAAQVSAKVTEKIPIPAVARRYVIGAGGGTVKAIMAKSGARIQLPKAVEDEDDSTIVEVQVEGNAHSVEIARREIEQIVAEHAAKVNLQMREVPPEFFPFIAGPNNRNLERFSGQNVKIHVPQYHHWTHRPPPTVSQQSERPEFVPHPGQSIQISGDRLAAYKAKAQIEREMEKLQRDLAVHEEYFAPGKPQFVFGDRGMSLHDFLEETGCAVVLPSPNSKDSETVTIIGPPAQLQLGIDKAINLAAEVQSENLSLGRYHANAPQGADAHARNLTRYLQKRELIREIEKASNSHIVPSSVDGPVMWNIFSRDGRNMHQARGDIIKVVEAHPPSRISQVNVDPFFHPHIQEQFSKPMQEELHVHVLLPDDDVEHLVLVYEGPGGLDERFQAPRQKPSSQELALFQQRLEQAQNRIFDLIRDQDRIVSSTVPAPRKYHDKLRKFVDRQQQTGPPQAFPVLLQLGGPAVAGRRAPQTPSYPSTVPSENEALLRGPNQRVEELKAFVLAFLEQQEKEEVERGYTTSVPFPQKFVSQLVGREGSNINKMRDEFDVEITPSNDQVTIKGPQVKAERCKAHIVSLSKKLEDEESLVIKVPPRFHADMIGPGGKTVRRLEERYLVRVQFPRNSTSDGASIADGASEAGGRRNGRLQHAADEITIRGPRRGAQEVRSELLDLKQYLEDHSYTETVSVARPQVRLLMGKGGRDIELLRQETGAKIDVPNGQSKDDSGRVDFKLSGTKADVQKAKKILQEKTKSFDDIVTKSVNVDRKYYKDMIGVRGANIQRIVIAAGGTEKDAHAVKFPDQKDDSTLIKVSGPDALVTKIIGSIKSFVAERANQTSDSIEVPIAKRGQLIGREGRIRQGIENEFNVSVNIPKAGNQASAVEISGSAENVAKAKAHIATLIKDQAGETITIPISLHHTISDRGNLFRRLRNDHQVTVDHSGQKPPPRPSTPLTSPGRPAASTTLPLIIDDPSTADASETYSWQLISSDPTTNASTGTEPSGSIPWILSGPSPEAIANAKSLIDKAVERASKPSTTGYLILPDTSAYGAIIGPGGRKINEIRRETGCEVQVPNARGGGGAKEAIEIRGTEEGCEKAKTMILEAVKNGGSGNGGGRRRT